MASFIGTAGSDQGDLKSTSKIGVGSGYTTPNQALVVENKVGIGYNNASQSAVLAVNGSVGIGTTVPFSKLHVDIGTSGSSTFPLALSNYAIYVPAVQNNNYYQGIIGIGETSDRITAGILSYDGGSSGAQDLLFAAGNNSSGASERMRIRNTGNVGIGTSNPSTLLHVYDASFPTVTLQSSHATGMAVDIISTATNGRSYRIESTADGSSQGAGKLSFRDNTASATRLIIDSSGSVGIGLTNPSYPLDVNGNINASGYYVSGTQGRSATINYLKSPSGSGTLTFTNGILTSYT